jgi:hypothetical protein
MARWHGRQSLPSLLIYQADYRSVQTKNNLSVTIFPQKDFISEG